MNIGFEFLLVAFGCVLTAILGMIAMFAKRGLEKMDKHTSVQQLHTETITFHRGKLDEHGDRIKEHAEILTRHTDKIERHGEQISSLQAQSR